MRGIRAWQYSKVKPRVKDKVVILAGPDKGRAGTLLGIDEGRGIIKLTTRELKIVDLEKVGKLDE